MTRKKCFAEGGEVPEMGEDERPAPTGMSEATKLVDTPAEPKTFGAAFKAARASGEKTFTWQGKKYTTDVAKTPSQTTTPKRDIAGADGLPSTPAKRPGIVSRMREKDKDLNNRLMEGLKRKKNAETVASKDSLNRDNYDSKMGLNTQGLKSGGQVRGSGKASKGVKAAKYC